MKEQKEYTMLEICKLLDISVDSFYKYKKETGIQAVYTEKSLQKIKEAKGKKRIYKKSKGVKK